MNAHPAPERTLPRLGFSDVRDELVPAAERLARLIESAPRSANHAVGEWTVAETAAHLTHVWTALPMLAKRDLAGAIRVMPASEGLGTPSGSVFSSVEELAPWTRRAVAAEPERDLTRLCQTIRDRAQRFRADDHDDATRPWIFEGVHAGPALFACHALNETLVHGDDIARAGRQPWPITPRAAALVLRCFLLDVVSQVVSAGPPDDAAFSIDLRLVGQDRFFLIRDAPGMRLEKPSDRPVDVHLRADPASLLLFIWRRRALAPLVARGRIVAWGRRPWRLRRMLALTPDV